jgi:tetratricopeptide (TPR) repeat protein
MKRRRLNGKALLILVVVVAAVATGTGFAHHFQVKRNVAAVAEQARQAEREGDQAAAARYLEQYIFLEPTDADARGRFALLLYRDPAASSKQLIRAYVTMEDVLRRDGDKPEVRRAAAELAVRYRRFKEAREHVDVLSKQSPGDPELLLLKGQCELRAGSPEEAVKALTRIGEVAPDKVELCRTAAELLRRNLQRPVAANQIIEQMVGKAPDSVPARQAAARYYAAGEAPDWGQVEQHARYALDTLKAQNAELSLLAAQAAMAQKQLDRAKTVLENGLKQHPDDLHLRQLLARVELMGGHKEKAREAVAPAAAANAPKTLNDLWAQAALMIDLDQPDRVAELVKQIEDLRGTTPAAAAACRAAAACLKGHLLVRQKKWGDARPILEKARADTQTIPDMDRLVHLLLAECYTQQGNTDQAAIAYRHVLKIEPANAAARRGLALAQAALGKTDEALVALRALATQKSDARADLARVLLIHNRRKPAAERDWAEFNQALEAMSAEEKASPAGRQLRIDGLLAQDKADDARKLVEAERDRDPKQVGPWLLLAGLAARENDPNAVPALLAEAERQAGWHVEWELARLAQALRTAGGLPVEKVAARVKEIESTGLRGSDADKARLLAALAEASRKIGDRTNAKRLGKAAVEKAADKLSYQFTLFEMALQDGDSAEAARLRDEIRKSEGPDGPVGLYCEAACQTFEARKDNREALAAARAALNRAAELRPSWARLALLDGDLCELEGRRDKALEKYQEAMEHGEMRLPVVRRVLQLLYEQHRYAEAHALLKKLPEPAVSQTDLGRIAAELYAVSPDEVGGDETAAKTKALQMARQSVAADAKDYRGQMWLGQLAARAGQAAEAEAAFRKAVELADTVPETWASLVLFLARTDPKRAEAELEKAKTKIARNQLPLVLAPAYEALGRVEPAEVQYRAALDAKPADPAVMRAVASFYARTGQAAKAVPVLKKLVGEPQVPEATRAWARRALAVSLSAAGTYQQFKEALSLFDANARGGALSDEDRLTKALLLARQPAHRKEAIQLFETLPVRKGALPPDAELMFAELYDADGNWPKAHAHYRSLVNENDKNPVYLVGYVRALLRHDGAGEAADAVKRLVELRPEIYEAAELQARVLKAQGREADAVGVVQKFAAAGQAPRLVLAAGLFEQIGRTDDAERLFREFAKTAGRPDAALPLAAFYGRNGRVSDALAICEAAWKTCPPEAVARACVPLARLPQATDEHRRKIEGWLRDAAAKHPQMTALQVTLADLYDGTGKRDEAVALYRKTIQDHPGNVVALNNLAFLLALRGSPADDALAMIQKAIELAGPLPELLDTRAVIFLKTNQTDLAIKDLQQAIAQAPAGNVYYHLAEAQLAAHNRSAAGDALRKAQESKLKPADLHPLERDDYTKLAAQLRFD